MTDMTNSLSARIAARRLEVCVKTIRRWVKSGKLPVIRYPSGRYRIASSVVTQINRGQTRTFADT